MVYISWNWCCILLYSILVYFVVSLFRALTKFTNGLEYMKIKFYVLAQLLSSFVIQTWSHFYLILSLPDICVDFGSLHYIDKRGTKTMNILFYLVHNIYITDPRQKFAFDSPKNLRLIYVIYITSLWCRQNMGSDWPLRNVESCKIPAIKNSFYVGAFQLWSNSSLSRLIQCFPYRMKLGEHQ